MSKQVLVACKSVRGWINSFGQLLMQLQLTLSMPIGSLLNWDSFAATKAPLFTIPRRFGRSLLMCKTGRKYLKCNAMLIQFFACNHQKSSGMSKQCSVQNAIMLHPLLLLWLCYICSPGFWYLLSEPEPFWISISLSFQFSMLQLALQLLLGLVIFIRKPFDWLLFGKWLLLLLLLLWLLLLW